jgi:GNAT superfamily N-acetyltransferase
MADELVTLKDGTEVLVRPLEPADGPLLRSAFAQLSAESRYKRFLGPKPRLSEAEIEFFTDVDHVDHEAIGALDPATQAGIGVARYVRLREDAEAAEAAVVVVDAWQRRGLGRILLERLCERAAENGVRRFVATLFTSNRAMLHLFDELGHTVTHRDSSGTLEIEVELPVDQPETMRVALRQAAAGVVAAWLDLGAAAVTGGLARRPRRGRDEDAT